MQIYQCTCPALHISEVIYMIYTRDFYLLGDATPHDYSVMSLSLLKITQLRTYTRKKIQGPFYTFNSFEPIHLQRQANLMLTSIILIAP